MPYARISLITQYKGLNMSSFSHLAVMTQEFNEVIMNEKNSFQEMKLSHEETLKEIEFEFRSNAGHLIDQVLEIVHNTSFIELMNNEDFCKNFSSYKHFPESIDLILQDKIEVEFPELNLSIESGNVDEAYPCFYMNYTKGFDAEKFISEVPLLNSILNVALTCNSRSYANLKVWLSGRNFFELVITKDQEAWTGNSVLFNYSGPEQTNFPAFTGKLETVIENAMSQLEAST